MVVCALLIVIIIEPRLTLPFQSLRRPGIPHAIMLEYPTFGSLHTFLVTKRRSKASGSTHSWGGLQLELSNDRLVFALPEAMRESLSTLLDDPAIRERPFRQQLRDPICDVDQLLFALQIAHGMKFLTDNNVSISVVYVVQYFLLFLSL